MVTLKCSKKQKQNTAYGFEQIIYDRYEGKTKNIMNRLYRMTTKYLKQRIQFYNSNKIFLPQKCLFLLLQPSYINYDNFKQRKNRN